MSDGAAKDYTADIGLGVSECTENVKLGVKRPAILQNRNNVRVCGDYFCHPCHRAFVQWFQLIICPQTTI